MPAPDYSSPCIDVCTLDSATQTCLGCFRTIDEIASWTQFSDSQRAAVRAALPARKREHASARPEAMRGRPERCLRCGAGFLCGAGSEGIACWCASYPPVEPGTGTCLCPACLATASR